MVDGILALQEVGVKAGVKEQKALLDRLSGLVGDLCAAADKLEAALAKEDAAKTIAAMNALREAGDGLEKLVDDETWPLPKYGELLFIY